MGEPAKAIRSETAAVEGLEEIFVSTVDPADVRARSRLDQGWTLTEAAKAYQVTERTLRRWIKEQRISAWKLNGPRGPEWRINPGSTPDIECDHTGSTVSTVHESATLKAMFDVIKDLTAKLTASSAQLQAASFRNGYLEAQLAVKEEQLRLLPDFEAKAREAEELKAKFASLEAMQKRRWWRRFMSWFGA